MTREEKIEKIKNLVEAKDVHERAAKVLRKEYPRAPEAMIDTGVFHVFTDGVDAALDWLVAASEVISDEKEFPDAGVTYHLLYHLHNWYKFSSLLPSASKDLLDLLNGLKHELESGNKEAAKTYIEGMTEILDAYQNPD